MLYLSIALVIIAIIFSYKPPTFTINFQKTFEIIQPPAPLPEGLKETNPKDELSELNKKRPPTLDGVMESVNAIIHGFENEDEEVDNE